MPLLGRVRPVGANPQQFQIADRADVVRTAESSPRAYVGVRCGSSYQGFIQLIGPRKSCFPTSTPLWRRIA